MFGGSKLTPGLDFGNSFIGWDGFSFAVDHTMFKRLCSGSSRWYLLQKPLRLLQAL